VVTDTAWVLGATTPIDKMLRILSIGPPWEGGQS